MDTFELEVDRRHRLGLPAAVLAEAGLRVGEVIQIEVVRDARQLVLTPLAELLERYSGLIPGLATAVDLAQLRREQHVGRSAREGGAG
jgi:bifunctional DNA-binding transcriptional regulator/antitoxin component of YhaV-PrlF toxin-antitoxin module